jgi:hypothetical protein
MNTIEQHETEKTCNACGSTVINEYGRLRCSDASCITRDRDNSLDYDSDEAEIEQVRKQNKDYIGPAA